MDNSKVGQISNLSAFTLKRAGGFDFEITL